LRPGDENLDRGERTPFAFAIQAEAYAGRKVYLGDVVFSPQDD
jgi:hypothetical protein